MEVHSFKKDVEENAERSNSVFSVAHQLERRILLEVFPAEIWHRIFDFADNPDTLLSCANASSFLKELLEEKRTVYLYPEVIRILAEQNYLLQRTSADILCLRMVCKAWRHGTNRLLDCPQILRILDKPEYKYHFNFTGDLDSPLAFRLYKSSILDKLESEILPLTRSPFFQANNPFPTRHLEILEGRLVNTLAFEWYDTRAFARFRNLTNQFLQNAGHHFWHAQICTWVDTTALEWVNLVWKYAWLMPNLKSLIIQCPKFATSHLNEIPLHELPPFPKLSDLQYLYVHDAPTPIMNAMLRANPHVKVLVIPKHDIRPVEEAPLQLFEVNDPRIVAIYLKSPAKLESLPGSWRNLEVLTLDLCHGCDFIDWSIIFNRLESYAASLLELHLLYLPPQEITQLSSTSEKMLNLPNLKALEIQSSPLCPMNFLKGCQNLEFLHLRLRNETGHLDGKGIAAEMINDIESGYDRSRYMEWGIWRLLPKLKSIKIRYNSGTARKYTKRNL